MDWPREAGRRTGGRRRRALLAALSLLAAGLLVSGSPPAEAVPGAYTFVGQGTGPVPDGGTSCPTTGPPLDVTFQVTGMPPQPLDDVRVSGLVVAHPWVADLVVVLIAPNGTSHLLFGLTGISPSSAMGASADLAGPYVFADDATQNWWATAAAFSMAGGPIPAGAYRTGAMGGAGGTNVPTTMTPAFAGITDPNGIWTLRFSDSCVGDLGSVSAATLELHSTGAANCAREQADATAAQAATAAADASVTAATSAVSAADLAVRAATRAVSKGKARLRTARRDLHDAVRSGDAGDVAKAEQRLDRAKARLSKAKKRRAGARTDAALARQALASATAAAARARSELTRAQIALAACRAP